MLADHGTQKQQTSNITHLSADLIVPSSPASPNTAWMSTFILDFQSVAKNQNMLKGCEEWDYKF